MCNYAYLSLCEASHCYSNERERGRYIHSGFSVLHAHLLSASLMLGQPRGEAPKTHEHDEKPVVYLWVKNTV